MKIIKPSIKIETPRHVIDTFLGLIESAARTCYQSESKGNAFDFVRKIVHVKKHESVIEHANITVRIICDRGVSHEIVRHRLAAYSQESTRYCNYSDGEKGLKFIHPYGLTKDQISLREELYEKIQNLYELELSQGVSPQIARGILPNSLKTEIVMTCNLREWRHVFKLRTASNAHPQIREIMRMILDEFIILLPEVFDDLYDTQSN